MSRTRRFNVYLTWDNRHITAEAMAEYIIEWINEGQSSTRGQTPGITEIRADPYRREKGVPNVTRAAPGTD